MKLQTGYIYHIKDEFFNMIDDKNLMMNHERGRKRPTYFAIKDKDILWFIPLSSKVDKYKKIIDKKIKRYGFCNTILIRNVISKPCAILLQNAFPTLEKYVDHVHIANFVPTKVSDKLKKEILDNFKYIMKLKEKGINLFFADTDKILEKLKEIK